jgi:hypothetical protein
MDYETVANFFLVPNGDEPSEVIAPTTPARRLRGSVEAIATIGWWSRAAAQESLALGHGFFDGYVWGRAASMGADVNPTVVVSAFGVFNAELLVPTYQHGRATSSHEAVLAARSRGASRGLREAAPSVAIETITSLGDRLLGAIMQVEPGPRHLFGALQSLPIPEDPYGRLWRAAELVREHRGDSHLAACAVASLDMCEMNVLTELWLGYGVGDYSASRGYSPGALTDAVSRLAARGWVGPADTLSEAGRATRDAIETATDAGQAGLISLLGDDLDRVIAEASQVTSAILVAQAAPADPRKRAAG